MCTPRHFISRLCKKKGVACWTGLATPTWSHPIYICAINFVYVVLHYNLIFFQFYIPSYFDFVAQYLNLEYQSTKCFVSNNMVPQKIVEKNMLNCALIFWIYNFHSSLTTYSCFFWALTKFEKKKKLKKKSSKIS